MNSSSFNKSDNYVVSIFVLSLLFSGANVYALAYPMLKFFVFLGFFCVFYRFKFSLYNIKSKFFTISVVFLIFVWFLFSILSSLIQVNDEMLSLSFRYMSYFFVLIFIGLLREDVSYLFYKWYSTLLFFIALLSFFSYILSVMNITNMVEFVSSGGRIYLTTFFNIVMSDSKMSLGGVTFYRFQSVFEEPGTFAFLILPVIYWYKLIDYSRFKLFILIVMLFCTLSVGAIFSLLLILAFFYFIKKPLHFLPIVFFVLLVFIVCLYFFPELSDFLSYKLGVGKYDGQHSSFGVRVLEITYVIEMLTTSIFGVGFSPSNVYDVFGNNVSVGLFRLILYSGAIGGSAIILLNFLLFFYSSNQLSQKNRGSIFTGFTLLTLLLMGIQRSTFMDGFLFITLFSFLLKIKFTRNDFEKKY